MLFCAHVSSHLYLSFLPDCVMTPLILADVWIPLISFHHEYSAGRLCDPLSWSLHHCCNRWGKFETTGEMLYIELDQKSHPLIDKLTPTTLLEFKPKVGFKRFTLYPWILLWMATELSHKDLTKIMLVFTELDANSTVATDNKAVPRQGK